MKPGNDTVEQIGPERHPCLPILCCFLFFVQSLSGFIFLSSRPPVQFSHLTLSPLNPQEARHVHQAVHLGSFRTPICLP